MTTYYIIEQPVTLRLVLVDSLTDNQTPVHTIKAVDRMAAYEKARQTLYWNKRPGYGYFA